MGRPKGSLNKPKPKTKPKVEKKDTKLQRFTSINPDDPSKAFCTACGKKYPSLSSLYFSRGLSEMNAGRDYYLPVCKDCLTKIFIHYTESYGGDEKKAMRRVCMMFDIYYDDGLFEASGKITSNQNRVLSYVAKSNLKQYRGYNGTPKTYDSTIDEEKASSASPFSDIVTSDEVEENVQKYRVTKAAYERWGGGIFEPNEYQSLEEHYQVLHKNNPNIDSNQEIFVKRLCHLDLMMKQSMQDKDTDRYAKVSREYSKTFQEAGLKTVVEQDASNSDMFGVTLALISQLTPEEFYADKSLYKDYDQIGEYFDRHVKRPMENLITGTDVRDNEFFVPEEDNDE